jgi:hypothetical protein
MSLSSHMRYLDRTRIAFFTLGAVLICMWLMGLGYSVVVTVSPAGEHRVTREFRFNGGNITFWRLSIDPADHTRHSIKVPIYGVGFVSGASQDFFAGLSLWIPGLAFIALAWRASRGLRRLQGRAANECCPHCGYDLRMHSAGDRCPECGSLVL